MSSSALEMDNTAGVQLSSMGCSTKEATMDRSTIDVTIPVEPEAAAALTDSRNREAVGRLVSRVLRPMPVPARSPEPPPI